MGLFRRSEDRALTVADLPKPMVVETVAGVAVPVRESLRLADVYACVRVLADAGASCPLITYARRGDARERVDNATSDLLRAPAPGVTQAAFVSQAVATFATWGECFIAKYREAGVIVQLGLLPPDRVEVELRAGEPVYTYTDPRGVRHALTRDDVVHARGLSVDGLRGASPVALCREAHGLSAALAEHASAVLANGAAPGGILKVPAGPAADELVENLREAWEERHGGARDAARVAVVAGDIDISPVTVPLADLQFLEQREHSTREIARLYRVPPSLISASSGDSLTYATTESESIGFVRWGIGPILRHVEQAISADLDLCPPGTFAEFLLDGLMRADSATRAQVYAQALSSGWMTRNEVRRRENLPPVEGGDELPPVAARPREVAVDA